MSKISVTTIAGLTSGGDANTVKIESGDAFNVVSGATTLGGAATISGDLTVDTSTLKVDSSNNKVGIGLTAPQELLHIKDGSIAVGNGTASNNSLVGKVGFSTDSSNSRFTGMECFRGSDAANTDLRFHTFGGDSDSGERMRISNTGAITMTKQPSFRVGNNNANWVNVTSGNTSIIEFDGNVYHNVGSHYSTANDRFTAPIAGRYLIGYHAYVRNNAVHSDGTSAYGYVRLKKNGNNLSYLNNIFGYANHTDNDIQMTLQTVIELAANDYMQVALTAVGGTVQHYGNSSQFYGHLLS